MKTMGLIGGMSWESSLEYYRIVNQMVRGRLGGQHSAKLLMYSVDFAEIEAFMTAGKWDAAAAVLGDAALRLEKAGADFFLICTNTLHKVAHQVTAAVNIPLLHIADVTAKAVLEAGVKTAGLLGTRFTMEDPFLKDRLTQEYGIQVLVPEKKDRDEMHRIIFDELCLGKIEETSRQACISMIRDLEIRGAGGVILGCTEIPMLVAEKDAAIPLFDTTAIHAGAAVDLALEEA